MHLKTLQLYERFLQSNAASRLLTVSDQTNSATYSYLANSSLVSQIVFKQSGTTRMTTTNQYDYLDRLTSKASGNGFSYAYQYNLANQRTEAILSDGSHWNYNYDSLGQVTSGKKYWSDWTPAAGEQFEYAFDDIGNRTSTAIGGDSTGGSLRSATYLVNDLNQYTNRTVPNAVDIMGLAYATSTVTVNGNSAYRKGEFYDYALTVTNSSAAVWQSVTNQAVLSGTTNTVIGNVYVPKTAEIFKYDADGNLTSDGRWMNIWDAENRLLQMLPLTNDPAASKRRLTFGYDYRSRRVTKQTENWDTNSSAWTTVVLNKFAYDGWNLLADINGTNNAVICDYLWGTDLSGNSQDAGGVGGLLKVTYVGTSTTNTFTAFDGNGNVVGLVNAADGSTVAQYEYGPFGELIRATGPMAKLNLFRFSTKYQDDESDLLYYGYRYIYSSTGRWQSRDPLLEPGFSIVSSKKFTLTTLGNTANSYVFLFNNAIDKYDLLGLDPNITSGKQLNVPLQGGGSIGITVGSHFTQEEQDMSKSALCIVTKLIGKVYTPPFSDTYWATFSGTPVDGATYNGSIFISAATKPKQACQLAVMAQFGANLAHEADHYFTHSNDGPDGPSDRINDPVLAAVLKAQQTGFCGPCNTGPTQWQFTNLLQYYACSCGLKPCKAAPWPPP